MFEVLNLGSENHINFKDEDMELVNLCMEGNKESFEILVKKHQKNIINLAFRILQNFEDACEIAQDSFFSAYKNIKKFKKEAKFSTWLYKITLNLSRNHLRKMKKKYLKKQELKNIDKNLEIVSDDPPPSIEMEKEETKEKVYHCLNLLSQEYKEIIILRDMEGLSYEEIGYLLKIPEGTVKSRLARARQSFIETYEKLRRK